jgi:hypothetical protein
LLSRKTRLSVLLAFVAAALVPGAAVFVPSAHACTLLLPSSPAQFVETSEVIVIGEAVSADDLLLVLQPEAFLKGPVSAEEIRLKGDPNGMCPQAAIASGERVLVYIENANAPTYPLMNEAYVLKDGYAYMEGSDPLPEVEVVSSIRAVTGQYAVPAETQEEGAGIDWGNVLLPMGLVLLIVFGIGLVLMRVWHRIDPS